MEPSSRLGYPEKDLLYSLFLVMPERQLKVLASVNRHLALRVACFRYDYTLRPLLSLKTILKMGSPHYPDYPPLSMGSVDQAICKLKSDLLPSLLLSENKALRLELAESRIAVLRNLAIGAEFVAKYPCGSSLETTKLQVIGLLRFRQFPYLEAINLILSRGNYFFGTPRRRRSFLVTVMVNYACSGKISAALRIFNELHIGAEVPMIYIKVVSKAYLLRSQYDDVIHLIQKETEPQRRNDLINFVIRILESEGLNERVHFFRNQDSVTGGTVQNPFSKMGPNFPIGRVPLK
jgi:hypothetical protein